MISQEVDLVAGDFNGIAWRRRGKDNVGTVDEVFMETNLPTPPGPTPLEGPGSVLDSWANVCGFLKPPGFQRYWKVNKHGVFSIPRTTLGLYQPIKAALMRHGSTWTSSTGSKRGRGKIRTATHFTKRTTRGWCLCNPKRRISEVRSDHSLSSSLLRPFACDIPYFVKECVTIHSRRLCFELSLYWNNAYTSPSDLMTRLSKPFFP